MYSLFETNLYEFINTFYEISANSIKASNSLAVTSSTISTSPSMTITNDVECGGYEAPIFMNNSDYGQILSPGFPNPYPNNVDCLWHIEVSKGMALNITFEKFKIEDRYI